ncbi:transcription antitermination factor NusB [Gloeocapsopsis dulcis]|uniref:Transcription antitermination protein NusB n=1 Tax=Gloeocapsopsis dulcis AAB1 = 1H9 TaxID=1433147 RepID=A0A6N8FV52_9CHRO|nr:transcription antitermination factor NusB [Gloeocapsopsis dulcis]MUL36998.1 transcription antitermination factor NusB [Gloeocapsopsis dulcis AAB1 = 1H9]WNN87852.1 transcription antitermination factor NusB [Gloeocapsopsis dulcis]
MQPRRIARELALLSLSQLPSSPEKLETQQLSNMVLAAVRTLTTEVQDNLTTAAAELQRASDRLLSSETRAGDLHTSRSLVDESIQLTQSAINRVGAALELPELIQLANQPDFDVRTYALQIVRAVNIHRPEIDQKLNDALVDWQVSRLARIDRDLLRIAVAEILYLGVPNRVAINEAVELAKRYSGDEGHRFINGVLRRISEQAQAAYPKS